MARLAQLLAHLGERGAQQVLAPPLCAHGRARVAGSQPNAPERVKGAGLSQDGVPGGQQGALECGVLPKLVPVALDHNVQHRDNI